MDPAAGKAGLREVDSFVVKYAERFEDLKGSKNICEATDSTLARKVAIENIVTRTANQHR